MTLRLDSTYIPASRAPGAMHLRLVNLGPIPLRDFRLAVTSVVPLTPPSDGSTTLVARISGWHQLAPPDGFELPPGAIWELDPLICGHRPAHANDGPASAYVVQADGSTRAVRLGATDQGSRPRVGAEAPPALSLVERDGVAAAAWAAAATCEQRVHPRDAVVLSSEGDAVSVVIAEGLAPEQYEVTEQGEQFLVRAGSRTALQWALLAMARHRRGELDMIDGRHEPCRGWRGLHVDVARQFVPAADVEWLIEVAAWHRLNRLHLHLTDDEGWRLPVPDYPGLTDVAAWRGDGCAVPPLLGSGADPTGGWYSSGTIARWVDRAAELGIDVVPEVDLPGHCFAALAALPELRDPDDASGAVSVQHFAGNVLNPGVGPTWPFLEAVFGELADRFPSPWLHLGGDEVPRGAWLRSPAAQRWADERGIAGTDAIAASFLRQVIDLVRTSTGRQVGVWQEAAEGGALDPGAGYVVAWKSVDDVRRLVSAGHQVVAAPAPWYYLDHAADDDWWSPGASWAGHASLGDVAGFDVTAGWSPGERAELLGIQACLWTEHVHDLATLRRLLLPRLTPIADAAWTCENRF